MKEIELIGKRKPREKHFLREDGCIVTKIYNTDIHYLKNGKYEEIDNTLTTKEGFIQNKNNDYRVKFKEQSENSLMRMEKDKNYIDIKLKNSNHISISKKKQISKLVNNIIYKNINDNIDIEYKTLPNRVKETIILRDNTKSFFTFVIDTNLNLSKENEAIIARNNDESIFTIERPYMEDSNGKKNYNVFYNIRENENYYELDLILDQEWLDDINTQYPVYVDPTISNNNQTINLHDTYIYPGDTNDQRGNKAYLKAGVEKVNGINRANRTLIKFDLPEIGTGSEIVYASLTLTPYLTYTDNPPARVATIHRVTSDWDETTANWNSMNDKYEKRAESMFYGTRTPINSTMPIMRSYYDGNITNLVKKWYRSTPNYGIMLKAVDESIYLDDDYPVFYSKDNGLSNDNNPQPLVTLVYRNHNGLENYLDYRTQSFTDGNAYVNTYNGNLTTVFNLGHTVGGNLPVNLDIVYNTNDVVLNNETFFKKGYKLNLEQTIKEVVIDSNNYLEYLDEDGTIHYFTKEEDKSNYKDEDGLSITIEKTDDLCTMIDNDGNKMLFTKIDNLYRLTKIIDIDDNYIDITLNSDNSINKVTDKFGYEVNIIYNNDNIIISSPDMTTTLSYTNDLLTSIETINGVTTFEYNEHGIVNKIADVTGLKIQYEYYSYLPYRVLKVTQIGLNDTIGESFSLDYGFDCTNIIDNHEKTSTLIYNSYGNLLSENSMTSGEDIDNAYSINQVYGNESNVKNRILSNEAPIKYIKNYLKNASFESDTKYFNSYSDKVIESYSTEECISGYRSLKIDTLMAGQSIEQVVSVPKGKYYTFSGYFKPSEDIEIKLMYADQDGKAISSIQKINTTDDFERNDVTIYYDENATSDLRILILFPDICSTYIDDIQLEEGEVANGFNMIENSNFSEGYSDWTLDAWSYDDSPITAADSFSIAKFNDNKSTALKVSTNPTYGVSFQKVFPIKGKKGDLFTCSFWYKNLGIPGDGPVAGSNVSIYFKPVGHDADYCINKSDNFNPNENKWQFFTYRDHAPEDFESITLAFVIGREANDFYLTNLSLYKDVTSGEYNYDENGNLISATDQSNNTNVFKYDKKNQLISMTDALGKNFKYEYDNKKTNRVLSAISSTGISNRVVYDKNGNPKYTRISKRYVDEISDGLYKIRNKGTNKYIKAELNMVLLEENECSNTMWKLEKNGKSYKIIYNLQPDYSISYRNGNIVLDNEDTNNLFILEKNTDSLNGSYYIKYYEKTADGTNVRFLTANGTNIEANIFSEQSPNIEFYIELKDEEFIEKSAEYTNDNRFVKKITDSDFSEVIYDTNLTTGLVNSIENASGYIINYDYNNKKQLNSISSGDRIISYVYNDRNLLSKISQGNKEYNFTYDEFLNYKSMTIGNNITYITNEYENNNGNISSIKYGNNQQISYEYDCFNRIKTIHKIDNDYNYRYDNNGNIAKILSNNNIEKCKYDASNRLYEYNNNNFKINYMYNSEDEVLKQTFKLDNAQHSIMNTFDEVGFLTKSDLDNNEISYTHDKLGRLSSMTLPNGYNISYDYIENGKRVTDIVKSLKNGNNEYSYKYDNLNNITHQYYNDNLTNRYYYNQYNELIKEENYIENKIIEYNYDNYGNLLTVVTKSLNTNEIKQINNYQYNDNNWLDQLISYNGLSIIYDTIGNPLTIGDNISMNWINGRELNSYNDNSKKLSITYEYNVNGIRTSKIVNGIKTEYYLEGNHIIFEKRQNDLIYYLYDYTDLIGLNYNGETFYYVKNLQGDIIGILNSNGKQIVTYEYDSWGKIISVKDLNGNLINDINNIGQINPFRYRGYYYDIETELYYLNSRYYNPEWKRFINADTIICANQDLTSLNLYTYVSNNPIMFSDYTGHGLKSNLKKFVKKAVKTIKKVVKTVAKKIKQTVSNIFSYKVGASGNISTKKYGFSGTISVSTGASHSRSESVIGSDNSAIEITSNFLEGTIELAQNGLFSNFKISMGDNYIGISYGIKATKDKIINGTIGIENFQLYGGYQTDNENGDETYSNYGRLNINLAPIILVVVAKSVKIPTPQLKTVFESISAIE